MESPVPTPRLPKPSRPVNHPPAQLLTSWPKQLIGDVLWNLKHGQWIALRIINDQSMLYQSIFLLIDPVSYQNGPNIRLINDARELQYRVGLYDINQEALNELARLLKLYIAIYNLDTGNWTIGTPNSRSNRVILMVYGWNQIRPLVYFSPDEQKYVSIFDVSDQLLREIGLDIHKVSTSTENVL